MVKHQVISNFCYFSFFLSDHNFWSLLSHCSILSGCFIGPVHNWYPGSSLYLHPGNSSPQSSALGTLILETCTFLFLDLRYLCQRCSHSNFNWENFIFRNFFRERFLETKKKLILIFPNDLWNQLRDISFAHLIEGLPSCLSSLAIHCFPLFWR